MKWHNSENKNIIKIAAKLNRSNWILKTVKSATARKLVREMMRDAIKHARELDKMDIDSDNTFNDFTRKNDKIKEELAELRKQFSM